MHVVHAVIRGALGHVLSIALEQLVRQGTLLLGGAGVREAGLVGGVAPCARGEHKVACVLQSVLVGVVEPALPVGAGRQTGEGLHQPKASLVNLAALVLQGRLRLLHSSVVVGEVGVVKLLLSDLSVLRHRRPVHLLRVVHGTLQVLGAPQALTLGVNAEVDDHHAPTGSQLPCTVQENVVPVAGRLLLEGHESGTVLRHLAVMDVLVAEATGLAAEPVHAGGGEAQVERVVRHGLVVEGTTNRSDVHTAFVLFHVRLQAARHLQLTQCVTEHGLPLIAGLVLVEHPHVTRRLCGLDFGD
mmetsp:Transcript_17779/g.31687  ORF Transcript_17779/g.31687 Transcript_17779/m.31687 type:complete len:300 (+) Transcript_17779:387-1286(+)